MRGSWKEEAGNKSRLFVERKLKYNNMRRRQEEAERASSKK